MSPWLQTIIDILTRLFGGTTSTEQAQTNQRLGKVEQQRDAAQESVKEAEVAKQIDENNSRLSDAELAAKLQRPPDSGGK